MTLAESHPLNREGPACTDRVNCEMCRLCQDSLLGLEQQRHRSERHLAISHRHEVELQDLENQLSAAQQRLEASRTAENSMQEDLENRRQEWQDQRAECSRLFEQYNEGKQRHLNNCASNYYEQSCEKACIELQLDAEHGCAVVEGSEDGDAFNRGGVEAICQPPAPSWIMRPWLAIEEASTDTTEQCSRITARQDRRGHRTTSILKAGWMWKQSSSSFAWSSSKRRYFILESGSQVRSATLRYFREEPSEGGEELFDKSITMRDAVSVENGEDTDRTVLRSAEACFAIRHHYRGRQGSRYSSGTTYDICVNGQDYAYASNEETQQLRDEWVAALRATIGDQDASRTRR